MRMIMDAASVQGEKDLSQADDHGDDAREQVIKLSESQ